MNHKIHLAHYFVLFVILFSGLFGFWYFSGNGFIRFIFVFFTLLGYVIWGIIHHYSENRLSWGVILEYLLLSLVILAAFSLTIRF